MTLFPIRHLLCLLHETWRSSAAYSPNEHDFRRVFSSLLTESIRQTHSNHRSKSSSSNVDIIIIIDFFFFSVMQIRCSGNTAAENGTRNGQLFTKSLVVSVCSSFVVITGKTRDRRQSQVYKPYIACRIYLNTKHYRPNKGNNQLIQS